MPSERNRDGRKQRADEGVNSARAIYSRWSHPARLVWQVDTHVTDDELRGVEASLHCKVDAEASPRRTFPELYVRTKDKVSAVVGALVIPAVFVARCFRDVGGERETCLVERCR